MGPVNRPLDLDWLEDFLALTETGNFSRAAQARSIAQPAFSRHIRSLEEWAGVELVDRSQHPASPTPAGEVIVDVARDVVLRLSQARARAQEAHEQAGRSLRFAATHVLSLSFFPAWLQRIEQHLRLQLGPIHMVSDSFQACEELMLRRRGADADDRSPVAADQRSDRIIRSAGTKTPRLCPAWAAGGCRCHAVAGCGARSSNPGHRCGCRAGSKTPAG